MPQESPTSKEQLALTVPDARADREGAGSDAEPDRRPVTRAARGHARRGPLPRSAGFCLVAGVLFLLLFVSGAASPLYGVYQAQWRFSATTLTAVFAVYALVLLVTLLVFGSVSDYLGRRRVIAVALAASAGACGLFLAAHGAGLLFAARALTGASAGAATSAGGAALIDLQPEGSGRAPVVSSAAVLLGLAAGGLGTEQSLDTEREAVLRRGLREGELQMPFQQRADVRLARIVYGKLLDSHHAGTVPDLYFSAVNQQSAPTPAALIWRWSPRPRRIRGLVPHRATFGPTRRFLPAPLVLLRLPSLRRLRRTG